jgi:large subunit ribosomal protein L9
MKVILKQYVYKHGVAGDIVQVADGFARNYLLPRGLAVKATKRAIEDNQSLLAEAVIRRDELNDRLLAVSRQIDGVELIFGRKAGSNGKLYGSVTTSDIAQALLDKTGLDINRRRISEKSLRELGRFEVPVRMGTDLSPVLHVTIVREEDLAEYLASIAGVPEVAEATAPEAAEASQDAEAEAAAEVAAEAEAQG